MLSADVALLDPALDASESDGAAVITGEVLKPEITVVMSRENLNKSYDLELKEWVRTSIQEDTDWVFLL